jgi:hypothetical protein
LQFFKGKQNFDIKSNNFADIIEPQLSNAQITDHCFEPELLLSSENQIEYIDTFKVSSDAGILKYKLNLELIFFTDLKSLRVNYINQMNLLNDKLAASKQECIRMTNLMAEQIKGDEYSSDSAINLFDSSGSQTNKASKPSTSSLTLIDLVSSISEDGKLSLLNPLWYIVKPL